MFKLPFFLSLTAFGKSEGRTCHPSALKNEPYGVEEISMSN